MTKGAFWKSAHDSVGLLKKLNLLREDNLHQNYGYIQKNYNHPAVQIHADIYRPIIEYQDYDILMYDYSVIQLSIDDNNLPRMVYVQNPLHYVGFEEYLCSINFIFEKADLTHLRYMFKEEYDQFRSEQKPIPNPVYFRYDVDPVSRKNNENIHAYAHLHVGLNNNIRIPVGLELTPFSFVIFILRHVYYDNWVRIIRDKLITDDDLKYKSKCNELPLTLWTEVEKQSLYIC